MAEENKVMLHGMWASPFVKRVELALKIKGISYEFVEEDLMNKSSLLLKYNPVYKKVPVLVHNGNPISESLVILEYIDETWKNSPYLLPEDPYQRAQIRFWTSFLHQQLLEVLRSVGTTTGKAQEKGINELLEKLNILEDGLKDLFEKDSRFVNGEEMGLLDIIMCSLFGPYKAQEEALGIKFIYPEKTPRLFSWLTALIEHPLVKEATPPHEKSVEIIQFMRQSAQKSLLT